MKSMSMSRIWLRVRRSAAEMLRDCSGIVAVEFAMIVPFMLVAFFGAVEISTGVAVDRKVSLVARTLSDLTSQSVPPTSQTPWSMITDTDLQNIFTASIAVVSPYSAEPTKATISEIYVDSNGVAKVQWSKAATIASNATQATLTSSNRNTGDVITMPAALLVNKTYVILSEVRYLYKPTVGYVMTSSVTLSDLAYSRPRQVLCVIYNNLPDASSCPTP
jgi:Flp pilus assembly protein TadG